MHKLRTLDVWDTLLRRDCHPECLKLGTARHALLRLKGRIVPHKRELWALYRARLDSELSVAQRAKASGLDDEYHIEDVLADWLSGALPPESPAAIAELAREMARFELASEIQRSFADGGIEDFLRSLPAERTIFLSDFYMDAEMLGDLLAAKGLGHLASSGIASCDVGRNKRSGALFHHVHSALGVAPHEHVHVGDNEHSDVLVPRALGIESHHYLPGEAHTARRQREALFESRQALCSHVEREVVSKAALHSSSMSEAEKAAFSCGAAAAPLFAGFALFCAEQSLLHGDDALLFLTREGEFFKRVHDVLCPSGELAGHPLPRASVLEVSRLSTFGASMEAPTIKEFSRLWNTHRLQKVASMLTTVGLDASGYAPLLSRCGLAAEEIVTEPAADPRIHKLFSDPEFARAATESLSKMTNSCVRYLDQSGVSQLQRVGVVDVGWSGSIQDNLALLLPDCEIHGYYLGLLGEPGSRKHPYAVVKSPATRSYFDGAHILEMVCSSPNGSVEGYALEEGVARAIRSPNGDENAFFSSFAAPFQDGVLFAAAVWRSYIERYVVTGSELVDAGRKVWRNLIKLPPKELARGILTTPQHDVLIFGDFFTRSTPPGITALLRAPFSGKARSELKTFVRRFQWSESVWHLEGVSLANKVMLSALLRLSKAVQIAKLWRVRARGARKA